MKTLLRISAFIGFLILSTEANSQRPNFVIIMLDDAHENSLPPDGPAFLSYPSISRIYNEGLRVCNAYCIMPLCNPARYTTWTGTYPHTHGVVTNTEKMPVTLPTLFTVTAAHGYHNAYVGKYSNVEAVNIPGLEQALTIKDVDQDNPKMFYNNNSVNLTGSTTVIIDDTAQAWLSVIDTPFIMGIGHIGTHKPLGVVDAYKTYYDGLGVIPDNYYPYTHDYPSFLYADTTAIFVDSNLLEFRKEQLYEIQQEIDRGVDSVFAVLEARGLLDNTMIIFTNDNGFMFEEHYLWGKTDPREPCATVPLFIRYPDWFNAGMVNCNSMIGLHDLFPTILDAADISEAGLNLQGESIRKLVKPGEERTSLYLEAIRLDTFINPDLSDPSWRAVRTQNFKYIRHHCYEKVEELFDMTVDPEENNNVVNNPVYYDTLQSLRALLDSLAISTSDTLSVDTLILPCTLLYCTGVFYIDADGDGYGAPTDSVTGCTLPAGYSFYKNDCNDANPDVHPGATEIIYNNLDDDCDGVIDIGTGTGNSILQKFSFSFSPNPSDGKIALALRIPSLTSVEVKVLDLSEKEIYSKSLGMLRGDFSKPLDLSHLPAGTYFLKVVHDGEIGMRKLVVVK